MQQHCFFGVDKNIDRQGELGAGFEGWGVGGGTQKYMDMVTTLMMYDNDNGYGVCDAKGKLVLRFKRAVKSQ